MINEIKQTQLERVLCILEEANGSWIDGMHFLHLNQPITQYHARIWELQRKGHKIESKFVSGRNWKEYRLVSEPMQERLI